MNKKRILTIALSLVLILVCTSMLFACNKKYEVTFNEKGSKVFAIKYEDIPSPVIDTYETFDEYKSSKYADMKLGGFDAPTSEILFDSQYFTLHNLIAVKFNDYTNVSHFIESVRWWDETHYNVDITRIENCAPTTYSNAPIGTYVCFLEFPKDRDISGANVSFNISNREIVMRPKATSLLTSETPLEVSTIESFNDFNSYYSKVNAKTQGILNAYNEKFFEDNYLIIVDYYFDTEHILTIDRTPLDNYVLDLYAYSSEHFSTNPRYYDRSVSYFAIPRDNVIKDVRLNVYYESNYGENNKRNATYVSHIISPTI